MLHGNEKSDRKHNRSENTKIYKGLEHFLILTFIHSSLLITNMKIITDIYRFRVKNDGTRLAKFDEYFASKCESLKKSRGK